MEIARVKEKFMNADIKLKGLFFLGIILFVATLPKGLFLPLGVLVVLAMFSESLWSGLVYIFKTILRFAFGIATLLLAFYLIMLIVTYFFT